MSVECTCFLKLRNRIEPTLLISAMSAFILQICDAFLVSGWHDDCVVCVQACPKQTCALWLRSHTGKQGGCAKSAWVFSLMFFLHLLLPPEPEHQTRTEILVLDEPLHHWDPRETEFHIFFICSACKDWCKGERRSTEDSRGGFRELSAHLCP